MHDDSPRYERPPLSLIEPNVTPYGVELYIGGMEAAGDVELLKRHGITTVVDNAFATSVLQRPMDFGADVVAYSATKMMDGQGRVLAGAVACSNQFMEEKLLPLGARIQRVKG